ncbi:hypothetical protein AVEN_21558-1 [Araneus ventricosus]|uniref:Uncharacterized protein n=1 Tax=Araneus ventricosus TaxID=182803 RepID=A0A4Y2MJK8_ARAVE|nr:hypothetical protein AVEN_21558-1 [Araneus ventricosus]
MTGSGQAWIPDLGDEHDAHFGDFDDKSKIRENAIIFSTSLLGAKIQFFQMIPCDVTACWRDYKKTVLGSQSSSVLIDWNGLWSFVCSASWKASEPSAIESAVSVIISDLLTVYVAKSESAVTVITSELLSVSVANLYKSYCSCFLYFVFF